ncbi:hypothetical protein BDK51DRAFT_47728 [Blyttiomyces helicus]|uniref:Uncharacterized protein n=1 Tax=Blyttiomyces helicus TaxID=388810 RepID=A0A4P9W4P7_9FUNG|nr:hypothetical protein BDK51DRAFT_47728 [Blyttiomyces helicus]|eukprot:RKO85680.1 hypothetical protein BDK51DRAFT_47728 [Blyttiomyces helicus]
MNGKARKRASSGTGHRSDDADLVVPTRALEARLPSQVARSVKCALAPKATHEIPSCSSASPTGANVRMGAASRPASFRPSTSARPSQNMLPLLLCPPCTRPGVLGPPRQTTGSQPDFWTHEVARGSGRDRLPHTKPAPAPAHVLSSVYPTSGVGALSFGVPQQDTPRTRARSMRPLTLSALHPLSSRLPAFWRRSASSPPTLLFSKDIHYISSNIWRTDGRVGLRRQVKALVSSEAWVQIPLCSLLCLRAGLRFTPPPSKDAINPVSPAGPTVDRANAAANTQMAMDIHGRRS